MKYVAHHGCADLQPYAHGITYKRVVRTFVVAVQNIFVLRNMAEPISIIAGLSSVASLADASCALAGSLYKTFRTIKDAPRAIQRLSKELGKFHNLLQDVYELLQCYSTSLLVTEDGLSVDSVQSMLKECQTELESVQRTTASFKPGPNRFKNAAARFAWVVDESKVKQHCQTIEQLRQHIDTGLSVLSQYVKTFN